MNLIIFILVGFLLFFLFKLFSRISRALSSKKLWQRGASSVLPLLELILWVAYAFWGVYILFGQHLYLDLVVGVMVVLLIVAIAWFVFRDLLAGVLLKTEKSLEPGQLIKTPFAEGKIKQLGSRSIELVNENGELIKIPYSRLSNEMFILPPENEDNLAHQVEIQVPKGQDPEDLRKEIRQNLFVMPWVMPPVPDPILLKGTDGAYRVRVTFCTHIHSQGPIVEEKLKRLAADE